MQISISNPTWEIRPYSGNKGCYAAFQVAQPYHYKLSKIGSYLGVDCDTSKLHCTLIYSKEASPDKVTAEEHAALRQDIEVGAIISHIETWPGHDGVGYIVAALKSTDLHKEHMVLRKLGAEHSFPDYKPHVTVYSGIELTDELAAKIKKVNQYLASREIRINLDRYTLSDVKQD